MIAAENNPLSVESSHCVLMFSGGRDSSLAAIRLREKFAKIILVTVVSDHLIGLDKVNRRIHELRSLLPSGSSWFTAVQPQLPSTGFTKPTCLPCHRAYAAVGACIAKRLQANNLAFGYVSYQSEWPEQGQEAVTRLNTVLSEFLISLHLPVYEEKTKEQVKRALRQYGLSPNALEQKCLQQQNNVVLSPQLLAKELAVWEESIRDALRRNIEMELHEQKL